MDGCVGNESPLAKLRRCARLRSVDEGRSVHAKLRSTGQDRNTLLGNVLVQMYSKCGSLSEAKAAFERIDFKNTFSWTLIIAAYAQNGHPLEALQLHRRMDLEGARDDAYVISSLIAACCKLGDLDRGRAMHARAAAAGMIACGDFVIENSLLSLYAKSGCLLDARQIFDEMAKRDVVSWNAMLTAYAQNGQHEDGVQLFYTMDEDPDSAWKKKSRCRMPSSARMLDAEACQKQEPSSRLCRRKILFHGTQCSHRILSMAVQKSVFGACSTLGNPVYGQELLERIGTTKKDDRAIVETAAFNMYAKCGSVAEARRIFDGMLYRDSVSWSSMIASYSQYEQPAQALKLYHRMCLEGFTPDRYTFSSVLSACGDLGALQQGKMIHSRIVSEGLDSGVVVGTALVDLYAKCGDVELARSVFRKMRNNKNSVTWNALLAGYLLQGRDRQVIELYKELETSGVEVSEPAVSSVLSSYANLSLEAEARALYCRLAKNGLDSSTLVGTTLIDVQRKFGKLEEARNAFDKVKVKDSLCWNSMLTAYARLGHYTEALRHLQEGCLEGVLVPNGNTLTSLLNSCSHSGLLEHGRDVFILLLVDHAVQPTAENFHCIADLLARSGRTSEAEDVIQGMPFHPEAFAWNTLLSGCTLHSDSTRGTRAAGELLKMPSEDNAAAYVLLSNLCRDDL